MSATAGSMPPALPTWSGARVNPRKSTEHARRRLAVGGVHLLASVSRQFEKVREWTT
jgi:hypothetical protein